MVLPTRQPIQAMFARPVADSEILDEIARRVEALGQSRMEPEAFHAEKSDLVSGLRRLAGRARANTGRRAPPTTSWRSPHDV